MEIEWVQRVPDHAERMREIREVAEELKITMTVHAPYYVNLNSPDKAKLTASKQRILKALQMAEVAGARSVCVHAAFYLGQEPDNVYKNVYSALKDIMKEKKKFPNVNLAIETMGKHSQFGTLDEALRMSKEFGNYPCVDFAHLHARSHGKLNTAEEWNAMLDQYQEILGKDSIKEMHIHYSGINYGPSGERNHLRLEHSDANWKEFLKVLKKRKVGGVLVCESPNVELDTILLAKTFVQMES